MTELPDSTKQPKEPKITLCEGSWCLSGNQKLLREINQYCKTDVDPDSEGTLVDFAGKNVRIACHDCFLECSKYPQVNIAFGDVDETTRITSVAQLEEKLQAQIRKNSGNEPAAEKAQSSPPLSIA